MTPVIKTISCCLGQTWYWQPYKLEADEFIFNTDLCMVLVTLAEGGLQKISQQRCLSQAVSNLEFTSAQFQSDQRQETSQ